MITASTKLRCEGQTRTAAEWAALLKLETGLSDDAALKNVIDFASFGKIYEVVKD
jgi:hypothetical protein